MVLGKSQKSLWLTLVALVVVGTLSALLLAVRHGERVTFRPASDASASGAPVASAVPALPDVAGRLAPLAPVSDLPSFLGEVEKAARARGRVVPEDYAQVRAAIDQLRSRLGPEVANQQARQFGEHLARVARELELKPVADELNRLATAIAQELDPTTRQKLVSDYRAATYPLPPFERTVALGRLEKLLSPSEK